MKLALKFSINKSDCASQVFFRVKRGKITSFLNYISFATLKSPKFASPSRFGSLYDFFSFLGPLYFVFTSLFAPFFWTLFST